MASQDLELLFFEKQDVQKFNLTTSCRYYYIFFSGTLCGIIFSEKSEKILAINKFFCQWNKVRTPK